MGSGVLGKDRADQGAVHQRQPAGRTRIFSPREDRVKVGVGSCQPILPQPPKFKQDGWFGVTRGFLGDAGPDGLSPRDPAPGTAVTRQPSYS